MEMNRGSRLRPQLEYSYNYERQRINRIAKLKLVKTGPHPTVVGSFIKNATNWDADADSVVD